ncbi:hypothetical protein [Streptomyces iconiensis]|uniref:Uncharacterized protein n=1 Tax=Streptomyces iconiensis TaxID=1384038 RepID=A0ABT7A307_9ACTN|nr:hypothetical protein [Streptomyces iconiensis]MDJ1135447.1 hypothetical protein [Streptomyces iconiensis]
MRLVVDEDQPADAEALAEAFAGPRHERWTGVELGGQEGVLPRLEVWLAGAVTPYGRLRATREAAGRGLVGWVLERGMPAVWNRGSLACLALRQAPQATGGRYELGVIAHGSDRVQIASHLAGAVLRFNDEARNAGEPVVRAFRHDSPSLPDGVAVEKPSVRLTIA